MTLSRKGRTESSIEMLEGSMKIIKVDENDKLYDMIMIGICFCHNQSNTLKIDRQEHQKNP